jgi:hypothetical protein
VKNLTLVNNQNRGSEISSPFNKQTKNIKKSKMTNKVKNEKMVEISKTDLSTLLECAYILRNVCKSRDIEDAYNIIEDASIDSPTFDETGEYTDSEIEGMDKHIDEYVSKWYSVIEKYSK